MKNEWHDPKADPDFVVCSSDGDAISVLMIGVLLSLSSKSHFSPNPNHPLVPRPKMLPGLGYHVNEPLNKNPVFDHYANANAIRRLQPQTPFIRKWVYQTKIFGPSPLPAAQLMVSKSPTGTTSPP